MVAKGKVWIYNLLNINCQKQFQFIFKILSTGRLATKEEEEEVEEDLDENPDQLDIEPDLPYALPPSWCLPIVISPQQFESRSPDGRKGKKYVW